MLFSACKPATENQALSTTNTATVVNDNNRIDNPHLKVKNKKDYHSNFLVELEKIAVEMGTVIELDGNMANIGGEKIQLSVLKNIGETKKLKGSNNQYTVDLEITAENYTTLQYTAIVKAGEKTTTIAKQVYLSPHFFLGAESIEDPATGVSFLATKYSNEDGDCYYDVTIGEAEDNNKLKGLFTSNCNGKIGALEGDNTPFLSE